LIVPPEGDYTLLSAYKVGAVRFSLIKMSVAVLLLVGALAFLAVWFTLSAWCPTQPQATAWQPRRICALVKWAFDWQQLLGSVLALGAAFIGAYYLRQQIKLAQDQETERQRRRFAAARSVLPLTLSSLTKYATQCAALLRSIHSQAHGHNVPRSALQGQVLPALPPGLSRDLPAMIEASDSDTGSAISSLLGLVQYQHSRLEGLLTPQRATHLVLLSNIEQYLIDAAEVLAKVNALFDFARGEANQIPTKPTRQKMHSALFLLGVDRTTYPDIYATVDRRDAKYPPQ
jgi:hypothetical protein